MVKHTPRKLPVDGEVSRDQVSAPLWAELRDSLIANSWHIEYLGRTRGTRVFQLEPDTSWSCVLKEDGGGDSRPIIRTRGDTIDQAVDAALQKLATHLLVEKSEPGA